MGLLCHLTFHPVFQTFHKNPTSFSQEEETISIRFSSFSSFFTKYPTKQFFLPPPVLREVRFIFGILLVTFPLVDYYTIGGALIVERKNGRNCLQVS